MSKEKHIEHLGRDWIEAFPWIPEYVEENIYPYIRKIKKRAKVYPFEHQI